MRKAILVLALHVSACANLTSWDEVGRGWLNEPISKISDLWGPPDDKWIREDGNTIYKYHLDKLDQSCVHYWVVDDREVISDFYYEGYCRPIG